MIAHKFASLGTIHNADLPNLFRKYTGPLLPIDLTQGSTVDNGEPEPGLGPAPRAE